MFMAYIVLIVPCYAKICCLGGKLDNFFYAGRDASHPEIRFITLNPGPVQETVGRGRFEPGIAASSVPVWCGILKVWLIAG
jgi:hypothetical protein